MTKNKKLFNYRILFICILLFSVTASLAFEGSSFGKTKIKLSKSKLTLTVGQSKTLKISGSKKKVKWSSSSKKIATVSRKGKVVAKKKGTATIKAKVKKKTLKCKVTVKAKTKNSVKQTNSQMANAPTFIGFKTFSGKPLGSSVAKQSITRFDETDMTTSIVPGDQLVLKLSYKNPQRDSILEIVLNDSQYGKKQIYTSQASINKIMSSDTYYDETEDVYITDLVLKLPVSKDDSATRTIEIAETCFLRETVGLQGYVDMSQARSTSVDFNISTVPIPNSEALFTYEKNTKGDAYIITGLNPDYTTSSCIYFPRTYDGLPVNELAWNVLDKAKIKTVIIPETISIMRTQLTFSPEHSTLERIYLLSTKLPSLRNYSGTGAYYLALEYAKPKVIMSKACADKLVAIGKTAPDISWFWTYYDGNHTLHYYTEDGKIYEYDNNIAIDNGDPQVFLINNATK